jgi:hypothetical protein
MVEQVTLACARCLANELIHGDLPHPVQTIFDGEALCHMHFVDHHLPKFDRTVPKGGKQ